MVEEVVKPNLRRALAVSVSGQALEWYDFALYGLASAIVFPAVFFTDASPVAGVLASFATFAVGFVGRPLGGFIFGRLGDRIGRKPVLLATLLLMGLSTIFIGLLPGYHSVGIAAPILLVTLRFLQGIGIGGEWSGAATLVIENAPSSRRGFYASLINSGEYVGTLIASALFAALTASLPKEAFVTWGWRVPFLLASLGVLFSLILRTRLEETASFSSAVGEAKERPPAFVSQLRRHGPTILIIVGLRMLENSAAYIILAFAVSYTVLSGGSQSSAALGVTVASVVAVPTIPFFGWVSDKLGRRRVYLGGVVFLAVFGYPFFALLQTGEPLLIWTAFGLAYGLGMAPLLSVQPSWFAEMFPTQFRYSGTAIGANIATVLAGGLAPLIATALYSATGNLVGVLSYLGVLAAITFASTLVSRETLGSDIDASEQEARVHATIVP